MKNRRLWSRILLLLNGAALLLEVLPWGVVMCFLADPAEDYTRVYCSFFDPISAGYGLWGPLLAAGLSCVALLLAGAHYATGKRNLLKMIRIVAGIAAACALSPILIGPQNLTVIEIAVTAVLVCEAMLAYYLWKPEQKENT